MVGTSMMIGAWRVALLILPCVIYVLCMMFEACKEVRALVAKSPQVWQHVSWRRFCIRALLCAVALICIVGALFRPQLEGRLGKQAGKAHDLVVILDVSRSMLTKDVAPDRLSLARKKIKELIQSLGAARVALILSCGDALIQCPLTPDRGAFELFLDGVDRESLSGGTTRLDLALTKACELFASGSVSQPLVLLVSDGEDFSLDLRTARQKAHEAGICLCALGVGTVEGGPIPLYNEAGVMTGYQKDEEGHVVISKVGEALLKQIALEMKGMYVPLRDDRLDIDGIRSWIKGFTAGEHVFEVKDVVELFPLLSAAALFLLLGVWL